MSTRQLMVAQQFTIVRQTPQLITPWPRFTGDELATCCAVYLENPDGAPGGSIVAP